MAMMLDAVIDSHRLLRCKGPVIHGFPWKGHIETWVFRRSKSTFPAPHVLDLPNYSALSFLVQIHFSSNPLYTSIKDWKPVGSEEQVFHIVDVIDVQQPLLKLGGCFAYLDLYIIPFIHILSN